MLIVLQLKRKGKICKSFKISDAFGLIHSLNIFLFVSLGDFVESSSISPDLRRITVTVCYQTDGTRSPLGPYSADEDHFSLQLLPGRLRTNWTSAMIT